MVPQISQACLKQNRSYKGFNYKQLPDHAIHDVSTHGNVRLLEYDNKVTTDAARQLLWSCPAAPDWMCRRVLSESEGAGNYCRQNILVIETA